MQTSAPISRQNIREDYLPGARDFLALLKPRVMSLVIFTAIIGMVMAPGDIHPVIGFTAILCIAVGAGASGCLNMWYEADLDALMERTKDRPIPAGRMDPQTALHFGVALATASVLVMGLMVNVVAGALLLMTILFYVVVYTIWLKRRTSMNIVIGGAAGAFPPMIAWAAVTGGVSLESIVMFGIIFMWTPPHFWSLSLFACKDYKAAGIPMLPVVSGEAETRKQILIYTLFMVPVTMLPWILGFAGPVYGITAAISGAIFTWMSISLARKKDIKTARQTFFYSIFYLFLLFAVMGGEIIIGRMI
ncbi:MAG: protoheme IX farnesyltransferase [Alphaproteobacteria bacterium]|nr:MAG: protoheme IX farnesyltransferase [Alphaproteobacteria bacterium]